MPDILSPNPPALAVCGWSGSGKTTLLEATIPHLREQGLAVALVKHDAHGLQVDKPGKDSDRLFRAGADIGLRGPGETVLRFHREEGRDDLSEVLRHLAVNHDLVFVEGHKGTPLPKVWIGSRDQAAPPAEVADVIEVLPWDSDRVGVFLDLARRWLQVQWETTPVCAGLLVKEDDATDARTIAFVLELLNRYSAPVALISTDPTPSGAVHVPHLSPVSGVKPPLNSLLAALRWSPDAAWLFATAGDPALTERTLERLLTQRAPGRWIVTSGEEWDTEAVSPCLIEPQGASLLATGELTGYNPGGNHPKVWRVALEG